MKIKKKRTKKYYAYKIRDDFIPFFEHQTSLFANFFNEIDNKLKNFTFNNLINEGVMIYRFTFLYDVMNIEECAQEIRKIFDKYFIKYESNTNQSLIILLKEEEREIILFFLKCLKIQLFGIKSRQLYAKYMKETIINCNIYATLEATWLLKWIDMENVEDALKTCRKRIEIIDIIKNKKVGKIPYFGDDGSIQYATLKK